MCGISPAQSFAALSEIFANELNFLRKVDSTKLTSVGARFEASSFHTDQRTTGAIQLVVAGFRGSKASVFFFKTSVI